MHFATAGMIAFGPHLQRRRGRPALGPARPALPDTPPPPCWQWTPLHKVASFGHAECMAAILSHKPNLNAKERVSDNTPLHEAVAHAHTQCTVALLEHGADLKARD